MHWPLGDGGPENDRRRPDLHPGAVCGPHPGLTTAARIDGDSLHLGLVPSGFAHVAGDERVLDGDPLVYRAPGDTRGLSFQVTRRLVPVTTDLADGLPNFEPAAVHADRRRGAGGLLGGDQAQPTIAWLEQPTVAIAVSGHGVPDPVLQQIADALEYHPGHVVAPLPIDVSALVGRSAVEQAAGGTGPVTVSKLAAGGDLISAWAGGVHGEPPLVPLALDRRPEAVWVVVRGTSAWTATFFDARTAKPAASVSGQGELPSAIRDLADRDPRRCIATQPVNTWSPLAPSDTAGRVENAAVWTGTEMIVWGGTNGDGLLRHADGAAYNPATEDWRVIAPAPLSPRAAPLAVWTGKQMILWGGGVGTTSQTFNDGAADPVADKWGPIPPAPIPGIWRGEAVWTGTEMLVTGGDDIADTTSSAAYNPTSRRWRTLPGPPTGVIGASLVWTGRQALLTGGRHGGLPSFGGGSEPSDGASYDPSTNRWTTLGKPLVRNFDSATAWDGKEVIALGQPLAETTGATIAAAAYDPTSGRWRSLASPPGGLSALLSSVVWTGTVALAVDTSSGAAAIYDVHRNTWTGVAALTLSQRASATSVWTGSRLLIWGGITNDNRHAGPGAFRDGVAYRPSR